MTLGLGYPYTMVPGEAFKWAEGGTVGWGSQCGTITGGAAAIGMVYGATETTTKLVNALNKWYADEYGKGTNLCHVSVGNWGKTNGRKLDTPEMGERCAKLTGTVSRKVGELINSEMDGKLEEVAVKAMPDGNTSCLSCHGTGARQDSRMIPGSCNTCHPNPHKS